MTAELKRGFLVDEIQQFAIGNGLNEDDGFMHWFYRQLFDLDDDDFLPDEEIVDGTGERQIDIFNISLDDSEQTATINLIQVKNTNGFSANVVSLMKTGLDFIFKIPRKQIEELTNVKFREKILEVREIIKTYGNNNISVICNFVTMGDEDDLPEEATQNRENVMAEYGKSNIFSDFEFNFVGVHELDRLINLRRNVVRKISWDLKLIYDANRPSIVEFESAGVRSLLCTTTGVELAKLAQTEPRDAVFDANVRGHLGLGGRVNKSIYESSIDDQKASQFWFMNNGITMVCDGFNIVRDPDAPMVKITNLQIINGCQTTSSIRSAFERDELSENVKLQIKIYESTNREFIDNIVIATNNQNSIGTRDLYANDEVQLLIQRRMSEDYGLFYERKRGEAKSANIPKSEIVNMEKAGQAYIAVFKRQPTVSRAQKYKVFSKEFYSDTFEKGKPWQLAVAHELHKFTEIRGRKAYRELDATDPQRNILNYGVFHITRIFWWVIENETDIDLSDSKLLVAAIRNEDAAIEQAYDRSVEILEDVVDRNNETFINLNNYFKKATSQQNINSHLSNLTDDD